MRRGSPGRPRAARTFSSRAARPTSRARAPRLRLRVLVVEVRLDLDAELLEPFLHVGVDSRWHRRTRIAALGRADERDVDDPNRAGTRRACRAPARSRPLDLLPGNATIMIDGADLHCPSLVVVFPGGSPRPRPRSARFRAGREHARGGRGAGRGRPRPRRALSFLHCGSFQSARTSPRSGRSARPRQHGSGSASFRSRWAPHHDRSITRTSASPLLAHERSPG